MNILLTGGAGYIGSHVAVTLSEAGHQVVLLDNFSNSQKYVLERLGKILGDSLLFIEGDVRNTYLVANSLQSYKIDYVIHFAGLKAVGESVKSPIEYYSNNVKGSISLLEAMQFTNIKNLVFSSSATVYGDPHYLPIDENHPTCAKNAYGRSKLHIEEMLKNISESDSEWKISCLRYFNPVGAHDSGLLGDDSGCRPNNLMPYLAQVALGDLPCLNIFGNDYDTSDGTGVRDYIHVMDLAQGHMAAISYLNSNSGFHVFNLGTGNGVSVLELVKVFEEISDRSIPLKFTARRPGDVASCYAKAEKANLLLGWQANRTINDMCASAWNFQKKFKCKNP